MEEDRLATDLGIAADIEESQLAQAGYTPPTTDSLPPQAPSDDAPAAPNSAASMGVRQPKKRFIGRRAAAEAAATQGEGGASSDSKAIQSE